MLEKIKKIIQNYIEKYILAEDPNIGEEEKIFQEKKKQFLLKVRKPQYMKRQFQQSN